MTGSTGQVQFQTEPALLDPGTVYTNTAEIYFDRNEEVITNEVINTIGVCPDLPPGHDPNGPSRSGAGDGTNPGRGAGLANNPTNGQSNPNRAP